MAEEVKKYGTEVTVKVTEKVQKQTDVKYDLNDPNHRFEVGDSVDPSATYPVYTEEVKEKEVKKTEVIRDFNQGVGQSGITIAENGDITIKAGTPFLTIYKALAEVRMKASAEAMNKSLAKMLGWKPAPVPAAAVPEPLSTATTSRSRTRTTSSTTSTPTPEVRTEETV